MDRPATGATNAGAITSGGGNSGVSGVVSSSNSLVGTTTDDNLGVSAITALSNGNYHASNWTNPATAAANAGAVIWGNGLTGICRVISSSNSLEVQRMMVSAQLWN